MDASRRSRPSGAIRVRLSSQGVTKDTLKPGDAVVVTGSPGRAGSENKVHLKGIKRPGRRVGVGRGGRR